MCKKLWEESKDRLLSIFNKKPQQELPIKLVKCIRMSKNPNIGQNAIKRQTEDQNLESLEKFENLSEISDRSFDV